MAKLQRTRIALGENKEEQFAAWIGATPSGGCRPKRPPHFFLFGFLIYLSGVVRGRQETCKTRQRKPDRKNDIAVPVLTQSDDELKLSQLALAHEMQDYAFGEWNKEQYLATATGRSGPGQGRAKPHRTRTSLGEEKSAGVLDQWQRLIRRLEG